MYGVTEGHHRRPMVHTHVIYIETVTYIYNSYNVYIRILSANRLILVLFITIYG